MEAGTRADSLVAVYYYYLEAEVVVVDAVGDMAVVGDFAGIVAAVAVDMVVLLEGVDDEDGHEILACFRHALERVGEIHRLLEEKV